jgi:hypothetical protein
LFKGLETASEISRDAAAIVGLVTATELFVDALGVAGVTEAAELKSAVNTLLQAMYDATKGIYLNDPGAGETAVANAVLGAAQTDLVYSTKIKNKLGIIKSQALKQAADRWLLALSVVEGAIQTLMNDWSALKTLWDQRNQQRSQYVTANTNLCQSVNDYFSCLNNQCGGGETLPPDTGTDDADLGGTTVTSLDPNAKVGMGGSGPTRYVSGGAPLPYSVYFENQTTATASAQSVTVTDTLNSNLDLTTLTLGSFGVPDHVLTPPSVPLFVSPYNATMDLRPANNLLVKVNASLDIATGILTANFQSLDPSTNQPPTDPTAGFLPPGAEGSVFFTVRPKPGLSTNTQIQNQATIVFDVNPPISTATWFNTFDNTAPTSQVVALPAAEFSTSFVLNWIGADVGAGVQDYTIYVSDNGEPFSPFQTNTAGTSATFTGRDGHTYWFYSIARDLVGNVEAAKTNAEATTIVSVDSIPPTTTAVVSALPNAAGWNNSNVTINLTSVDNPGGSGVKQITYSASGAQTIPNTVVAGASISFDIDTEGITTITFSGTDNAGNIETARTMTLNIDKTPPAMTCSANPNVLWPPNNQLAPINVSVNVTDSLSGSSGFNLVSVTSSEPDSGLGDIQGFVGSGSTSGQLRAQRLGSGSGRTYTFVYSGADRAGNATSCATTVAVSHDQGH